MLVLLSLIAQLIVSTLPESRNRLPLDEIERSARMAWEQSQIEGRIWRMQLNEDSWKLSNLSGGESGESGPFPGTVWVPVRGGQAQGRVRDGKLQISRRTADAWPASLLFMPDGEMTQADIIYRPETGEAVHLKLNATQFSGLRH